MDLIRAGPLKLALRQQSNVDIAQRNRDLSSIEKRSAPPGLNRCCRRPCGWSKGRRFAQRQLDEIIRSGDLRRREKTHSRNFRYEAIHRLPAIGVLQPQNHLRGAEQQVCCEPEGAMAKVDSEEGRIAAEFESLIESNDPRHRGAEQWG